jgi:hypothetical protein
MLSYSWRHGARMKRRNLLVLASGRMLLKQEEDISKAGTSQDQTGGTIE